MKSVCFVIIGYGWTCLAVRSAVSVGTFRSVNVSLCGAG